MADTARKTQSDDEVRLVTQAINGDSEAFSVLYSRHLDAIYRYIYMRVGHPAETEDLTEDVFVRAWEALPNYRPTEHPFTSWLYRIAHNLVVDYHRRRKPLVFADDEQPDRRSTIPLTEEMVERRQETDTLAEAIQKLGEEEQMVILLRFVEGLSHREVAAIIGKTEEASRIIQHRALAALNRHLSA